MADFSRYAPKLKRLEGGFVNNPNDKGGATNCGVTLFTFRSFFGKDKTVDDLRRMTSSQWTKVMKSYWTTCKADEIRNQSVAEMIVDWHINAGRNPLKTIQEIIGTTPDGQFGPMTIGAINAMEQRCLHCKIRSARITYYENLVRKTPSQAVFLKGWLNRVNEFQYQD